MAYFWRLFNIDGLWGRRETLCAVMEAGGIGESAEVHGRSDLGSGKGAVVTGIRQAWCEQGSFWGEYNGQWMKGVSQGTLVSCDGYKWCPGGRIILCGDTTEIDGGFVGAGGVGKHTELTDKQTGIDTKKRTFTDIIKKGKLPQDMLNKRPVEQLKEVFGKELNRSGTASWTPEVHNLVKL